MLRETQKHGVLLCYSHGRLELQRREGCLWGIQSGWMWIICRKCSLRLLRLTPRKAAALTGSSACSLCFAFTDNRRAGREWRGAVWHEGQRCFSGQRCCRHARWGITTHMAAGFHCTLHTTPITLCFLQMCSPAQLRQQSEELYAVIDEILASSTPVSSIKYIL